MNQGGWQAHNPTDMVVNKENKIIKERNYNREHRLTCFVRAGIDGIGSDGSEDSLCAVLGSYRFLLIFHGLQCFELLGMFSAFVVGRSLALQRRTK